MFTSLYLDRLEYKLQRPASKKTPISIDIDSYSPVSSNTPYYISFGTLKECPKFQESCPNYNIQPV